MFLFFVSPCSPHGADAKSAVPNLVTLGGREKNGVRSTWLDCQWDPPSLFFNLQTPLQPGCSQARLEGPTQVLLLYLDVSLAMDHQHRIQDSLQVGRLSTYQLELSGTGNELVMADFLIDEIGAVGPWGYPLMLEIVHKR